MRFLRFMAAYNYSWIYKKRISKNHRFYFEFWKHKSSCLNCAKNTYWYYLFARYSSQCTIIVHEKTLRSVCVRVCCSFDLFVSRQPPMCWKQIQRPCSSFGESERGEGVPAVPGSTGKRSLRTSLTFSHPFRTRFRDRDAIRVPERGGKQMIIIFFNIFFTYGYGSGCQIQKPFKTHRTPRPPFFAGGPWISEHEHWTLRARRNRRCRTRDAPKIVRRKTSCNYAGLMNRFVTSSACVVRADDEANETQTTSYDSL